MYVIYSINSGLVLKCMKYTRKTDMVIEKVEFYKEKLLMVGIMTKIKLQVLNFGYLIAINMTITYINFQINLQVSLKVTIKLT